MGPAIRRPCVWAASAWSGSVWVGWGEPRGSASASTPHSRSPLQAIEDGALGVMVPLLTRALRERSTTVKRRATIIIENMCKLVC